jgi:hypothetical protein
MLTSAYAVVTSHHQQGNHDDVFPLSGHQGQGTRPGGLWPLPSGPPHCPWTSPVLPAGSPCPASTLLLLPFPDPHTLFSPVLVTVGLQWLQTELGTENDLECLAVFNIFVCPEPKTVRSLVVWSSQAEPVPHAATADTAPPSCEPHPTQLAGTRGPGGGKKCSFQRDGSEALVVCFVFKAVCKTPPNYAWEIPHQSTRPAPSLHGYRPGLAPGPCDSGPRPGVGASRELGEALL